MDDANQKAAQRSNLMDVTNLATASCCHQGIAKGKWSWWRMRRARMLILGGWVYGPGSLANLRVPRKPHAAPAVPRSPPATPSSMQAMKSMQSQIQQTKQLLRIVPQVIFAGGVHEADRIKV